MTFSNCVELGTNSTISVGNPFTFYTITDPNGNETTDADLSGTGIMYSFSQSGTYEIIVTSISCPTADTFNIVVNPVSFNLTAIDINECEGQIINLENYIDATNSSLFPILYEWDLGAGNILTGQNQQYIVPANATSITVIATDGTGCVATEVININPTATSISKP